MDSKSISRKGVGVQLPSLAPDASPEVREEERIARELGRCLWSSLSQVLRAAREELDILVGGLRRDRVGALRDESRLELQEELAARTRRAGWCLGVLAAAQRVDLLHGRREPEGVRWMIGALTEARAFRLSKPAADLPLVTGTRGEDWTLSLLAAWCALQAGECSNGFVRWTSGERGPTSWLAFELGAPSAEVARVRSVSSSPALMPRVALVDGRLELAWQ